jgi:leucyl-tRNA synthetase
VINPDDIVERFGADSLRCYEMYMGPIDVVKPWNTSHISGVSRFLDRVYRLGTGPVSDDEPDHETLKLIHKTIRKVTQDTDRMRFNTALSAMMVLSKHLALQEAPNRWAVEQLVLLVSPYAPHVGEELWAQLGHEPSIVEQSWPGFDDDLAKDDEITIAIQVRGKVRGTLQVAPGTDKEELERLALAEPGVARHLEGQTVRKVIVVPDRIVNIVI